MYQRVLATNGGPHPPELWAQATCEDLIPIDGIPQQYQEAGLDLRSKLIDVLAAYHTQTQEEERRLLEADAAKQLASKLPDRSDADFQALMDEIQDTAKGTPWEELMAGVRGIQAAIRLIVAGHTKQIRHIERLWHADRNPELEAGQRYRELTMGLLPAEPTS